MIETYGIVVGIVLVSMGLFYLFEIPTILSSVIFGLMFGTLSLKLIDISSIPNFLIEFSLFGIFFYLGLIRPGGEFFKKYILQYRSPIFLSTSLTIMVSLGVGLYLDISTYLTIVTIFVFGTTALSTNSVALSYIRDGDIYKIFIAKSMINNIVILTLFLLFLMLLFTPQVGTVVTLKMLGKILGFVAISLVISRYIYPRIFHKVQNPNIHLIGLLLNSILQSYIADTIGVYFIFGAMLSSIFIPEIFLKSRILEPLKSRVAKFNSYTLYPIFGLVISLNIEIVAPIQVFEQFATILFATIAIGYLFTYISLIFTPLNPEERKLATLGTLAKDDISLVLIYLSFKYGVINQDIYTLSLFSIALLSLSVWYRFAKHQNGI
ncbi:MAG TPA: hypothetical protein EYG60_00440 [Campylobacterales bacterium]|nr:hypothetical protein [Campylobacterales bacterium]